MSDLPSNEKISMGITTDVKVRSRRELDVLKLLIVGTIVLAAVFAAVIIAVNPVGFAEATPELRGKAMDTLRDVILLGMGALGVAAGAAVAKRGTQIDIES